MKECFAMTEKEMIMQSNKRLQKKIKQFESMNFINIIESKKENVLLTLHEHGFFTYEKACNDTYDLLDFVCKYGNKFLFVDLCLHALNRIDN